MTKTSRDRQMCSLVCPDHKKKQTRGKSILGLWFSEFIDIGYCMAYSLRIFMASVFCVVFFHLLFSSRCHWPLASVLINLADGKKKTAWFLFIDEEWSETEALWSFPPNQHPLGTFKFKTCLMQRGEKPSLLLCAFFFFLVQCFCKGFAFWDFI